MCGRYYVNKWAEGLGLEPKGFDPADLAELWRRYHLEQAGEDAGGEDRFNVAPTARMPVVLRSPTDGAVKMVPAQWGLIPRWAKEPKMAFKTFNARSETVAEKPSFRGAWAKGRRCLVPLTGYYEWTGPKGDKRPHAISGSGGGSMMAAGLWEYRGKPEPLTSFTILTVEAGADTAHLHHRSPVLLPRAEWAAWLAPTENPIDDHAGFLRPPAAGTLAARAVSRYVSNSRNQGPECLDPAPEEPAA